MFFSEIYNCSAPLSYRFRWRGKEDDGALPTSDITNTAGDAVSSIQSINIPATSKIISPRSPNHFPRLWKKNFQFIFRGVRG